MKYIGDLSAKDAEVLAMAARNADSVLEFGCGGSTQVMAQAMSAGSHLVSLDTSDEWIRRTHMNLAALSEDIYTAYELDAYDDWQSRHRGGFDMIFVDGVDDERGAFAKAAFQQLKIGGAMLFHDTRRPRDLKNVLELVFDHGNEVADVMLNIGGSNITVVVKKALEPYENWNIVEDRADWMMGAVPPPADWPELLP